MKIPQEEGAAREARDKQGSQREGGHIAVVALVSNIPQHTGRCCPVQSANSTGMHCVLRGRGGRGMMNAQGDTDKDTLRVDHLPHDKDKVFHFGLPTLPSQDS